jgi:hypothetical protein
MHPSGSALKNLYLPFQLLDLQQQITLEHGKRPRDAKRKSAPLLQPRI